MSLISFIEAMPKVDLSVRLEGALHPDTISMILDQTDVASKYKTKREFKKWLDLYHSPNRERVDEIASEIASWVQHPEDIARTVYDLGVSFHKQNVRYAEVSVIPAIYTDLGLAFDILLSALNDGRDRVLRAWGVKINWVMAIPRSRPRKGDDIARWATSATGRKGNVVGLGLVGREDQQPVGQFRRAFATADKKELPTMAHAGSYPKAENVIEVIEELSPTRITDTWGLVDDEEALELLASEQKPLVVSPSREMYLGRIKIDSSYPYRKLLDARVELILGAAMPSYYGKTLLDTYVAAAQVAELTYDELVETALRGVNYSFLPEDEKALMMADFRGQYDSLRREHLAEVEE